MKKVYWFTLFILLLCLSETHAQTHYDPYLNHIRLKISDHPNDETTIFTYKMNAMARDKLAFEKNRSLPKESEKYLTRSTTYNLLDLQIQANAGMRENSTLSTKQKEDLLNRYIQSRSFEVAARPLVYQKMAEDPEVRSKIIAEVAESRAAEQRSTLRSGSVSTLHWLTNAGLTLTDQEPASKFVLKQITDKSFEALQSHLSAKASERLQKNKNIHVAVLPESLQALKSDPYLINVVNQDLEDLKIGIPANALKLSEEELKKQDLHFGEDQERAQKIKQLEDAQAKLNPKAATTKALDDVGAILKDVIDEMNVKREKDEREERLTEIKIQGAHDSVDLASNLLNLTGNPEQGRYIAAIGHGFINLGVGANKAMKAFDDASKLASGAAMAKTMAAASFISLSLTTFTSIASLAFGGPSDTEIILKAINNLREEMHERFDQISTQIKQIQKEMSVRFDSIDNRLADILRNQVESFQKIFDFEELQTDRLNRTIAELVGIKETLAQMQQRQYELAAAEHETNLEEGARLIEKSVNEEIDRLVCNQPPDKSFDRFASDIFAVTGTQSFYDRIAAPLNTFVTHAVNASSLPPYILALADRPRSKEQNNSRIIDDLMTNPQLNGASVDYLSAFFDPNSTRTPNVTAWTAGVEKYLETLEKAPQLIERQSVKSDLRALIKTGLLIRTNSRSLSAGFVDGNLKFDSVLISLINRYQSSVNAFAEAFEREVTSQVNTSDLKISDKNLRANFVNLFGDGPPNAAGGLIVPKDLDAIIYDRIKFLKPCNQKDPLAASVGTVELPPTRIKEFIKTIPEAYKLLVVNGGGELNLCFSIDKNENTRLYTTNFVKHEDGKSKSDLEFAKELVKRVNETGSIYFFPIGLQKLNQYLALWMDYKTQQLEVKVETSFTSNVTLKKKSISEITLRTTYLSERVFQTKGYTELINRGVEGVQKVNKDARYASKKAGTPPNDEEGRGKDKAGLDFWYDRGSVVKALLSRSGNSLQPVDPKESAFLKRDPNVPPELFKPHDHRPEFVKHFAPPLASPLPNTLEVDPNQKPHVYSYDYDLKATYEFTPAEKDGKKLDGKNELEAYAALRRESILESLKGNSKHSLDRELQDVSANQKLIRLYIKTAIPETLRSNPTLQSYVLNEGDSVFSLPNGEELLKLLSAKPENSSAWFSRKPTKDEVELRLQNLYGILSTLNISLDGESDRKVDELIEKLEKLLK